VDFLYFSPKAYNKMNEYFPDFCLWFLLTHLNHQTIQGLLLESFFVWVAGHLTSPSYSFDSILQNVESTIAWTKDDACDIGPRLQIRSVQQVQPDHHQQEEARHMDRHLQWAHAEWSDDQGRRQLEESKNKKTTSWFSKSTFLLICLL